VELDFSVAFYLLCSAAVALILALLGQPAWRRWQRARLLRNPFPAHWRKILRTRVPLLGRLPATLQLQLKQRMQVFIAEKPFIGCAGLHITEEMRVVIAAQACLLTLNRSMDLFANVRQILVYPGAFVVNRSATDGAGVLSEQRQALSGESWSQGQVILSWQDTLEGAADPRDGLNVVIHEFAHQLDQENGAPQGAPPPQAGDAGYNAARWKQVFQAAFSELQAQARVGHAGLLNHYGAQDAAEFFAVVSEVFFEQPGELQTQYPALYAELRGYYQLDPAGW
jgi:Mlc titration factor MtfA (ptsG expression regulator)